MGIDPLLLWLTTCLVCICNLRTPVLHEHEQCTLVTVMIPQNHWPQAAFFKLVANTLCTSSQAAGHLPPFLLTEAFAGNSQPGWLPELAMLGGLILKGALSLQEHKRHVQGYFEKATQVWKYLMAPGRDAQGIVSQPCLWLGATAMVFSLHHSLAL
jgi:hypothetical protein